MCGCQNKAVGDVKGEPERLPKISHPENVVVRRGRCQAYFNYPRESASKKPCFLYISPSCEAISCSVFSQEFGLARFKSNQVKAMKGLEYALSNLQGT